MLTLEEFKKRNKLSNEQLAALIGVSKEKVSMMLKGYGVVRNRDRIIPRLKELGIVTPGEEFRVEVKQRDPNELVTLNEYLEESGMTLKGLSELLNVPIGSLHGWLQGRRTSVETSEKLKKFGIEHPSFDRKAPKKDNPKRKTTNKKGFLKEVLFAPVNPFVPLLKGTCPFSNLPVRPVFRPYLFIAAPT